MKRMNAVTSQQLRNRAERYKLFVTAMENHLLKQTPIHDLVPELGTGEPAVYENAHFKIWISRNGQRSRAMNKMKACNLQLLDNFWNTMPGK